MEPTEVRRRWAERSGEYSPDYYAYYGPNETSELIRDWLDAEVEATVSDAAVLELGCSVGRHLAHLHEQGYRDLAGIDVNDDAFDVMSETYPDLAADGTFYAAAIEDVVEDFTTGQFDAVYSVETLQHVHPDNEWVFEEVARAASDLLITVENEGSDEDAGADENTGSDEDAESTDVNYVNDDFPLYYRNWREIFTEFGFEEVETEAVKQDTLRVFRSKR